MTIREAAKHIFKPLFGEKTIFQWMRLDFFRPVHYIPAPAGRGHGCRLDFADLVTLGLLHGLFSSGLKFNQLRADTAKIHLQDSLAESDWLPYDLPKHSAFWKQKPFRRVKNLTDRSIQNYLTQNDFKVAVCQEVSRPGGAEAPEPSLDTISENYIFPSVYRSYYADAIGAVSPYERLSFFNVGYWRLFVEARLSNML